MKAETLVQIIGADFYCGVPDSQLKALCNYLMNTYGIDAKHHMIAANEGNCTAIAAGYHVATGKIPVVYMQNSGIGNIINPVASLINDKVYAIPTVFIVGWRGEPGVHDEPQHIFQGEVTEVLLHDMEIETYIIARDTTDEQVTLAMQEFRNTLAAGKSVAFIVKKNALTYDVPVKYQNDYTMTREEIIEHITKFSGDSPIVSTTGKASRELFEIRERNGQNHAMDFLTVGSMGHSSSIAFAIANEKPQMRIWCIDGDGAALMHLGSLAVIGANAPKNLIHIVINNAAHETVGGMPTVAGSVDLCGIARACGYRYVASASTTKELDRELSLLAEHSELCFLEVKCSIGAREDLGRPTSGAVENKERFMRYLDSNK